MGKGHKNQGMYFYFDDEEQLERFIKLYGDLFVPYSEYVIYEQSHGDCRIIEQMKSGYRIDPFSDGLKTFVRVNLYPEGRDEILSTMSFKVTHETTGHRAYRQCIYKFKKDSE